MSQNIAELKQEFAAKLAAADSMQMLEEIRVDFLGKKGSVTELLKEIPKLDVSLRPEMGKAVNQVKNLLSEQIEGTGVLLPYVPGVGRS